MWDIKQSLHACANILAESLLLEQKKWLTRTYFESSIQLASFRQENGTGFTLTHSWRQQIMDLELLTSQRLILSQSNYMQPPLNKNQPYGALSPLHLAPTEDWSKVVANQN